MVYTTHYQYQVLRYLISIPTIYHTLHYICIHVMSGDYLIPLARYRYLQHYYLYSYRCSPVIRYIYYTLLCCTPYQGTHYYHLHSSPIDGDTILIPLPSVVLIAVYTYQ